MFDRMLAKGSPLHCAVLEEDTKKFKTLLREGYDVNARDSGGRTVVHLFEVRSRRSELYNKHIMDVINNVSHYEASLHVTDSVLQWTPLQYAIKSKNWFIVERLLESNVDRLGLDMIRQRAQNPDFINPIIIQAAQYGHLLLLEFLCSINVNIHQASSRIFSSPLHAAIEGWQLPVVRWLIQQGADCNNRYRDGQTPLFHAISAGSLDVVRALVEDGGASVDIRDVFANTAVGRAQLKFSCCKYRKDCIKHTDYIVEYLETLRKKSISVCRKNNT